MRYRTILFDLDHTLLDSHGSEQAAFRAAMAFAGVPDPHRYFPAYAEINRELWDGVERGEISPEDVKVTRFERFIARFGLDADPTTMSEAFVDGLGNNGNLYPGVENVLASLADRATLALVTNGIEAVQRTRIERLGLGRYFATIAISGELGYSKPGRRIFEWTFAALGEPDRTGSLMVGDSLTSDIAGGIGFGIDTAWYNPFHHNPPTEPRPTHEFHAISELVDIASGSTSG